MGRCWLGCAKFQDARRVSSGELMYSNVYSAVTIGNNSASCT